MTENDIPAVMFAVLSLMKTRSIDVSSALYFEKSFSVILKLVVTITVVIFSQVTRTFSVILIRSS